MGYLKIDTNNNWNKINTQVLWMERR